MVLKNNEYRKEELKKAGPFLPCALMIEYGFTSQTVYLLRILPIILVGIFELI
jgi:hypothetical protein